jgi:putative ABC transport system permease protein
MDFYLAALLQGLCLSAMVIGIYISMKIFNIPDITTDGSYTLGAAVTALLFSSEYHALSILPVVVVAGGIAGALTGLIHTKLKINALLAGILVMTALYSINLSLMGRSNIPLLEISSFFQLINMAANESTNVLIVLALFIILIIMLMRYILLTDFGLAMRATGNSEVMVRAMGVNTDRMKITGLAIANSLTATSGYLMAQFQGFTDISMGIGIVIIGLGAVIIGEVMINWLKISSIVISLLLVTTGAVIFQLVLAFTLSLGIDANLLKLVTALFVLIIVSLPRLVSAKSND